MTNEEQYQRLERLLDILEPCLKRERHSSGHFYYLTEYGYKSRAGLRDIIRRTLFEPDEQKKEGEPA